jgi:RimJ/RimL family protein N-acetyltransferase
VTRPSGTARGSHFISERITPEAGTFDIATMARGEPSLPSAFTWREQRYRVARTLESRRHMGEDRGDTYVRRHYYDIETSDALRMTLYFERNPSSRSKRKEWWLYKLTFPDPVIETERLILRRWTYADRDAFRLMVADPEVMRHLHALEPMSSAQADESLATTIKRYDVGYGDWAIEARAGGEIIGESGLTPVDGGGDEHVDGNGEVEIGWMLRLPFWGQGYAFEAASAVKQFAFERLNMPSLTAFVRPDNQRSSHLAEKLGMRPAGRVTNRRGFEMLKYKLERATV